MTDEEQERTEWNHCLDVADWWCCEQPKGRIIDLPFSERADAYKTGFEAGRKAGK